MKESPLLLADDSTGLALLLGDHTRRHRVMLALEGTKQGLEHPLNVTSEGMPTWTIAGDADRHHLEQHRLGLRLALPRDVLLRQFTLIV